MRELVQILAPVHDDRTGRSFDVEIYGTVRADGLWSGDLVFRPRDGSEVFEATAETEQSSRSDLEYWASGLSPVYLEGAFIRAVPAPRGA
jgi:hypothetical protein